MTYVKNIQAEETDQFTLPPGPLLDIGENTSQRLFDVLNDIVNQTNTEIQLLLPKAAHSKHAAKALALRRQGTYLADLLYAKTGPGFPRWLRGIYSINQPLPLQYKEKRPWKTIYWLVFSQSPLFVIGLTPTINMYGHYFGTDKIGHFFMQGHTYYKMYTYYLAHGKSPEQAHAAMITYGQVLEQTYLGTLINGVYSNADLSANYAGWKFYMNLTQSIHIGNQTMPPLLYLNQDKWAFSPQINRDNLLKPYLSDGLSEAWNPCRYTFMRDQIRKHVKKRCADWIEQKGITPQLVTTKLEESKHWHGETYGYWLPKSNEISLNLCFNQE